MISGLREERKLWGQELAIQGASLAQDRGRMEGQIDSLNREVKELREKLEVKRLASSLRDMQTSPGMECFECVCVRTLCV